MVTPLTISEVPTRYSILNDPKLAWALRHRALFRSMFTALQKPANAHTVLVSECEPHYTSALSQDQLEALAAQGPLNRAKWFLPADHNPEFFRW